VFKHEQLAGVFSLDRYNPTRQNPARKGMNMSVDIPRLRNAALRFKEDPGAGKASLKEVWFALGYSVYLDRSDIQCGPSSYINVGNVPLALWWQRPEQLRLFVLDAFRKLGQKVCLTEILRHGDKEAICVLHVTAKDIPGRRVYRGRSECVNDDMERARYVAIFRALMSALSEDSFLYMTARTAV